MSCISAVDPNYWCDVTLERDMWCHVMSRCVTMQCNNVTLHWPHINTNFAKVPALSVTHKLFQQYLISEIIFVIGKYEWLRVIYSFTYNKICPCTVQSDKGPAIPQVGCQRGRQQVVAIQTHTTAVNSVSATHSGLEAKLLPCLIIME